MSLFQAKRRYRSSILALGAAALTAIPLFAAVSTDYDHNANFRAYYTFSFYKVQSTDPFFDQRIKDEVTKDLTKAGYQMVPSGGDIAITAVASKKDEAEYNTFYDGLGGGGWGWRGWGGWGGGWGQTQTTITKVPVGTILLDMYDTSTHQLVWRGKSTDDTLSTNNEKNTKKLDRDIDHMLNGFPPKTNG
jgi:hypothetical protein